MTPQRPPIAVLGEAVEAIEQPIGQMVVAYGMVEQNLDFWLIDIFPMAQKAFGRKMPYLLGHKVDLLIKCFEEIGCLSPLKADGLRMLNYLQASNKIRNIIVHGAIMNFHADPEPTVVFGKLTYDKDREKLGLTDNLITLSQIDRIADDAHKLVADMQRLTNALLSIDGSE